MNGLVNLNSPVLLAVFGAFFIFAAVLGMSGRWKRWYWTSRRLVYLYLPIGILFLAAAVGTFIKDATASTALQVVEFALLGVAIWWVARPPEVIKPAWIRTIETHPKSVYEAMAAAVKKGEDWHPLVENPESLNKWIRSVEKRNPKTTKRK